jgi:hypothetical protein
MGAARGMWTSAAAVTLALMAACGGGGSVHPTVGAPGSAPATVKLGTRKHPLPVGVSGFLHHPFWSVTVVGFTPDAGELVAATKPANNPPKPDHQFAMARVRMTYAGPGRRTPASLSLTAVGTSSVFYDPTGADRCGVYPDDYTHASGVYAGGVVEGNVCWSVASADVDSLLLVVEPKSSADSDAVFMALR